MKHIVKFFIGRQIDFWIQMIWSIAIVIGCTTLCTSILICLNQHVKHFENLLGKYDQKEVYVQVVVSFDTMY
jgi:hypothetical protein